MLLFQSANNGIARQLARAKASPDGARATAWRVAAAMAEMRGLLPTGAKGDGVERLAAAAGIPSPPEIVEIDLPDVSAADLSLPGEVYTRLMAGRHAHGAYYTPRPLALAIARLALRTLPPPPAPPPYKPRSAWFAEGGEQASMDGGELNSLRIVDPAMGSGSFLLAAGEIIAEWYGERGFHEGEARRRAVDHLCGVDSDPVAVELARIALWMWSGAATDARQFVCADALGDGAWQGALAPPFDMVIGNPPFASVFTRARESNRDGLGDRFAVARGSYDLAALFVELAVRLCRDGGRVGLALPNKILAADHARPLRAWLVEHAALETIIDASQANAFKASVYPVGCVWRVGRPVQSGMIRVQGYYGGELMEVQSIPQSDLAIMAGQGWGGLLDADWEILKACFERGQPMGDIAEMSAGLTVAEAYNLRAEIFDAASDDLPDDVFRLVTSGLIGANRSRWGEITARYLGDRFARPVVQGSSLPPRRLAQARRPKLIIAGMGRTPRAMVDEGRSQASVATVIITGSRWPLGALGALINSRTMGRLARAMFGALALGGGHIRFGKREIGRLPMPGIATDDPRIDELATLAETGAWEAVDGLVEEMYGLAPFM